MDKDVIHELATGALLHDIGKIKVPDAILHKPGKLTDEEFRIMRSHVTHSAAILKNSPGVSRIAFDVAANHHERLDGNGYPRGLSATQLSMYARMIAIVDAYDAMTANRCYKEGLNTIIAFRILKKDSNVHFDAHLVDKFIQALGPHPVGSVVKLESGKLAIVSESNFESPLQPVVKTFYHTKLNQYTELKDIDLSDKRTRDHIVENVRPEDYKIDLTRFFKSKIL
jgi:HD-GYP domain-containing protein (c-di-GMP phosphodiesterase class II)